MRIRNPITLNSDEESALARLLHRVADRFEHDPHYVRVDGQIIDLERLSDTELARVYESDATIEPVDTDSQPLSERPRLNTRKIVQQRSQPLPESEQTNASSPSQQLRSTDESDSSTRTEATTDTPRATIDEPPIFHNRETGEMSVRVSNSLLDETPLGQFNQFNVGVDADKQALAFCAPTQTRMSGYEVLGQISIARSDSVTKIPIPKETGVFDDSDRAEQLVLTDGRLELYKLDPDEIEDLDTRLSKSAPTVSTAEGDVDLDETAESDTSTSDREAEIEQGPPPDEIDYPVFANVVVEENSPAYEIEVPESIIRASQYQKGDRIAGYSYFDIAGNRMSRDIEGYGDFDLREHPIEYYSSGNAPEEFVYFGAPELSNRMTVPHIYSYGIGDPLTLMIKRDGVIMLRPVNWDTEKEDAMWSELKPEGRADYRDGDGNDEQGDDEKDQVTLAVDEVMGARDDTDETDEIAITDALVSEEVTVEESPTVEGSHIVPIPEAIADASKFDRGETLVMYTDFGEVYSTHEFTSSDEYGDFDLADYPVGYYRSGEQPDGLQYHTNTSFSKSLSVPKAYDVAIGDDLVLAVDETGSYVSLTASDESETE